MGDHALWDPYRGLMLRAYARHTDVRVPLRSEYSLATLWSVYMLSRAAMHRYQENSSLAKGTLGLLCAFGFPFVLPHGVSLRKYGLAPRAVLEGEELHRYLRMLMNMLSLILCRVS